MEVPAAISMKAEGDILVTSELKDWEFAAEFDFGSNWPLPEDFNERINRTVERATRQGEATRQAEAVAAAEQRVRQQTRRSPSNWCTVRGVPTPPTEPVSMKERMAL